MKKLGICKEDYCIKNKEGACNCPFCMKENSYELPVTGRDAKKDGSK